MNHHKHFQTTRDTLPSIFFSQHEHDNCPIIMDDASTVTTTVTSTAAAAAAVTTTMAAASVTTIDTYEKFETMKEVKAKAQKIADDLRVFRHREVAEENWMQQAIEIFNHSIGQFTAICNVFDAFKVIKGVHSEEIRSNAYLEEATASMGAHINQILDFWNKFCNTIERFEEVNIEEALITKKSRRPRWEEMSIVKTSTPNAGRMSMALHEQTIMSFLRLMAWSEAAFCTEMEQHIVNVIIKENVDQKEHMTSMF